MKASGVVVTAALLLYAAGLWVGSGTHLAGSPNRRRYAGAVVLLALCLALELAAVVAAGHVASQLVASHRHRAPGLNMMLYWSPDVLLLLLLAVGGSAWGLMRHLRSGHHVAGSAQPLRAARRLLWHALQSWPLEVLCLLMIAGSLAAIHRVILLPRYLVMVVPLVVACVVVLLFRGSRTARLPIALGTLWIVVNLCNWNGALLPNQAWVIETAFDVDNGLAYARTGAFLERSHEYLADHRANQAAMKRLAAEHRTEPILVGTPLLHFLAFPRLGYVPQPLHGYAANPFTDFVDCFPPATPTLIDRLPRQVLIVSVGNTFSQLANTFDLPTPTDDDTIVFRDRLASPLIVYRKAWPAEADDESIAVWYVRRMWPHALVEQRALRQAALLARHGYRAAAIARLQSALEARPSHAELRLALVRLLLEAGRTYRAVAVGTAGLDAPRAAANHSADHATAHSAGQQSQLDLLDRALAHLRAGETTHAADDFLQAARRHPDSVLARFAAGMVHFHRHDLAAALAHFEAAARLDPQTFGQVECVKIPICHVDILCGQCSCQLGG